MYGLSSIHLKAVTELIFKAWSEVGSIYVMVPLVGRQGWRRGDGKSFLFQHIEEQLSLWQSGLLQRSVKTWQEIVRLASQGYLFCFVLFFCLSKTVFTFPFSSLRFFLFFTFFMNSMHNCYIDNISTTFYSVESLGIITFIITGTFINICV